MSPATRQQQLSRRLGKLAPKELRALGSVAPFRVVSVSRGGGMLGVVVV